MSDFRPFNWRESRKTFIRGESLTQQCHTAECDINRIVKRYDAGGVLPHPGDLQYMDVTGLQGDLTEKMVKSMDIMLQHGEHLAAQQVAAEEKEKQELASLRDKAAQFDKLQQDENS